MPGAMKRWESEFDRLAVSSAWSLCTSLRRSLCALTAALSLIACSAPEELAALTMVFELEGSDVIAVAYFLKQWHERVINVFGLDSKGSSLVLCHLLWTRVSGAKPEG